MNRNFKVFFYLLILCSCNNTETRVFELKAKNANNCFFEIINNGDNTAVFSFENNYKGVYNIDKIVLFIKQNYKNMPDAEKVWRFIVQYSKHKSLITKNNWLYNPVLLINSAGGGLCGFRSAAMTNILVYMGIKARSWCVNGHVVSEAYFDGRWQVYDPDLGVVYYNEKGNICSFNELSNNPHYITNPFKIVSISSYCDSLTACSEKTAEMYASKNDNNLFNTFYEYFDHNQQTLFMMPKGSSLQFPLPDKTQKTNYAIAELNIPKGWTGKVKMSLIPYDFIGNAEIEYQNKSMNADFKIWSELVATSDRFVDEIIVRKNSDGVVLRYYINPYIYRPDTNNSVKLVGEELGMMQLICKEFNSTQRPNWDNRCDDDFVNWFKFLTLYSTVKNYRVNSFNDYLEKVKLIEQKGAFKKFNIDSKIFYKQLTFEFSKYKNKNSEFWQQFEDDINFVNSLMIIINRIENASK